ncbi:MAG: alcohol dehydrogenase catalytic domain-containing protein [Verrucomicrobiales bacterium]
MTQTEIVVTEPTRFDRRSAPVPEPGPGEVVVAVERIGVCGTDIHAFFGRQPFFSYPRILGHELAVRPLSWGPDCGPAPGCGTGDLCAVEPYLNAPGSPASRRGKTNCCEALQVLGVHCDGGMRSRIVVPATKLHAAGGLSADQVALTEMLCIGRHAVDRAAITQDDYAVVIGGGPIGLSVLSFLRTATPQAALVDRDVARVAFAREILGNERASAVSPGKDGVHAEDLGGGELPSVIFDATGNAASMMECFHLAAHGGRIVFVGLFQGEIRFDDPNFHRRELTVLSSRNAVSADFSRVLADLRSGAVTTTPWISHRMALSEVPERFHTVVTDPTLRKAVIEVA